MPIQVKDATGQIVELATPSEISALTIAALGQLLTALQAQATAAQTQPVSLAATPLPAGAATDGTLASILAKLSNDPATAAGVAAIVTRLGQVLSVSVGNFPATQAVSLASAPLPEGAATNATLAQVLSALQTALSVDVQAFPSDYPDTTSLAKLEQIRAVLAGTVAVAAVSLPLPAGAATEATLLQVAGALKAEDSAAASGDAGLPLLAQRNDTDTPTTSHDGDYALLKMDEEGRLKVATKPASIASVVGVANTVAATVVCDVRRASNVVFHIKNVGSVTLAAGTFVFEASIDSTNGTDGTWFAIQAVRSNANTIETSIALSGIAAGAGYAASWEASVNGYQWMRLRCTVAVTASASAQWTIQRGSYATEPIPAAQTSATQSVSGTVTANFATPLASNINSAASTNLTSVKATAGTVYGVAAFNAGAAAAYVKLYNKASAPALATDVPVLVIPVPAGTSVVFSLCALGHRFGTGIALAITGGVADTDTTAVAAAQVKVATSYV